MVWAALVYAIVGTWLTDRIGRPLVRMNFDRQRYEADFRFGLVRFRENTEGVALYHGERDEMRNFRTRFGAVVGNWWDIMRQQKRLTWFTAGYGQAAIIFPFVVAAPRYFRGEIPLGGLVQTATAFGQVQDSLSFIVSSYTDIAEWRSVVQRLVGFEEALDRVRAQAGARDGIRREDGDAPTLAVENVDLALPGGTALISGVNLALARGESALLSGPSGAGKSTLIRAIAGIWPFGRGEIRVPRGPVLFLPQKPYLPIGTLREVISYPTPAGDSMTRSCARRSRRWACRSSPAASTRPGTGRSSFPRASSSESPSPAPSFRNPTGSSSTRQPPRWTRPRKRGSTSWSATACAARPCSASGTAARSAPSMAASSS